MPLKNKKQFFARVRQHVQQESAQLKEFVRKRSVHFVQERAFAVHGLVVGHAQ